MEEQGERYLLEEGKEWTRMDNYADAEWLNILYSLDPDRSWQTMFESPIYVDFGGEEDSLVHALILRVEQELDANTVYDRYWHGTVMLLRPLLVFMTMEQIYWFMAIVFVVLFVILCALLLKRGFTWLTVILAVLVIPCGLEYIPFCAEYWSPWLISLVLMIYILARRPGWWEGSLLMLVSGTAVAYMDFLTTETVAFGLPFLLLLLLWQQREPGRKAGEYFACFVRSGLLWAAGYGGALLVKWVGSSMLLGDDRIDFALNRAHTGSAFLLCVFISEKTDPVGVSGGLPDRAGTGPAFSDAFFSRELSRLFHLPCAVSYTGGPGRVWGKNDGLGDGP